MQRGVLARMQALPSHQRGQSERSPIILLPLIMTYVKLEQLKLNINLNHFAIKAKIYLAANQAALKQLRQI